MVVVAGNIDAVGAGAAAGAAVAARWEALPADSCLGDQTWQVGMSLDFAFCVHHKGIWMAEYRWAKVERMNYTATRRSRASCSSEGECSAPRNCMCGHRRKRGLQNAPQLAGCASFGVELGRSGSGSHSPKTCICRRAILAQSSGAESPTAPLPTNQVVLIGSRVA